MAAGGVPGAGVAVFPLARAAKGGRSRAKCANDEGAGHEEREGSFHAIAVGGVKEKSQASSEIR